MKKINNMSLAEAGALISKALKKYNIEVVLVGGGCVQIYTVKKYVTEDLNFVPTGLMFGKDKEVDVAMSEIGFKKIGRMYKHPDFKYTVEFPPGPLGVGEEYGIEPAKMEVETGTLSLLSPTDSVKDRLASYFYADDLQCLEQAVLICKMNKVDIKDIEAWAAVENRPEKFEVFLKEFNKNRKNAA